MGILLEPCNDDAAAQGVLMPILHSIPHGDESFWKTRVTEELSVLLSKRCSNEVHQMTQESAE